MLPTWNYKYRVVFLITPKQTKIISYKSVCVCVSSATSAFALALAGQTVYNIAVC